MNMILSLSLSLLTLWTDSTQAVENDGLIDL